MEVSMKFKCFFISPILLAALTASAQSGDLAPGTKQAQGHVTTTKQAILACAGKQKEADCTFKEKNGKVVSGICLVPHMHENEQSHPLACVAPSAATN
jgi:hypothetical protein